MYLSDINILAYAFVHSMPDSARYRQWLEDLLDSGEPFGMTDLVLSGFFENCNQSANLQAGGFFRRGNGVCRSDNVESELRAHLAGRKALGNLFELVPGSECKRESDFRCLSCRYCN